MRISSTENTTGGAGTWPRGSGAHPLPRRPTVALLHLSFHPHTPSSSHKHDYPVQTQVQAHFATIFDLHAQRTSHQTAWGIVPWYVTPPLVQLVFVLVLYSLQICAAYVTMFLSLHVKFIWFRVVLMHDIGSRNL